MKILFVASEVAPFAKTGGLADVTGSLPLELKRMGHDVRIIIPFYDCIAKGSFPIRKWRKNVEFTVAGTTHKCLFRQTSLGDIPVYLLGNQEYFNRDHLYGTPTGDYPDNHRRFAFFCRGVFQLLQRLDFRPDILHCHDWQTALVPFLLRFELAGVPFFDRTATVFTIHNLAYQGVFPKESLAEMGLDGSSFDIDRLEFYGKVNLMKGGILSADIITTVSPTYCAEIQEPAQGCGLDGVLRLRSNDLFGVLNGLDYTEWDPATDRRIFRNYTASSPAGKSANKKWLQLLMGLEEAPDIPLLGMVTRLTEQKGIDLLIELLPRFADERLQLVILGTGDERYIRALLSGVAAAKGKVFFQPDFDPVLASRIYAGSDIFLMPSRYEPCGLGQLIAQRYGSLPVVRRTGGLADTVCDGKEPTGFCFTEYTADAFREALARALDAYSQRISWKKLVRLAMRRDFSWRQSAKHYEELYGLSLERKGVGAWRKK